MTFDFRRIEHSVRKVKMPKGCAWEEISEEKAYYIIPNGSRETLTIVHKSSRYSLLRPTFIICVYNMRYTGNRLSSQVKPISVSFPKTLGHKKISSEFMHRKMATNLHHDYTQHIMHTSRLPGKNPPDENKCWWNKMGIMHHGDEKPTVGTTDDGMRGNVFHDIVVLQLSGALLFHQFLLLFSQSPWSHGLVGFSAFIKGPPYQMSHQLENLTVTIGGFRSSETAQSRRTLKTSPFRLHFGRFPPFSFRKLRSNDDQA